jgi:glyoxylase-like metal-dependent hydrolase (beta-lactamase superfamily II)
VRIILFLFVQLFLLAKICFADENILDQYPSNILYSKPVEFIPNVWTAIGATAPPTYENSGHNNNLSFIITPIGVVVINSGSAYSLAEALHNEIKEITKIPVAIVINENGQGHSMLGNTYWAEQNIPILAHEDAVDEFSRNSFQILQRMKGYNLEKSKKTKITLPSDTFSEKKVMNMGGVIVEVLYLGPSHSPGDTVVWLPDSKLVIAGDMAFHERLLPIFPETNTAGWIETWNNKFEELGARYVIPGHGHPTNMDQVRKYTHDYLVYLRKKIAEHLENGGDMSSSFYVDQSPYSKLHTFNELAARNAGRVFEQMEFE